MEVVEEFKIVYTLLE